MTPRVYVSLIQSDFGSDEHGNFEATLLTRGSLTHWWRDNSQSSQPWRTGQAITGPGDDVVGPGCIIQSDFASGDHGNFEVVVPLRLANGSVELRHFFHDNGDVNNPWTKAQAITGPGDDVVGPGCIIQSDFASGDHGNFEVVVPLRLANGSVELRHFFHDNGDVNNPWTKAQAITGPGDDVVGPGCIIQSDFASGDHGNFEVVVPLRLANGSVELRHFFHDNGDVNNPWTKAQAITGPGDDVVGPGCIIQSDFASGDHGNFEVVVPLRLANGSVELRHFFHDNGDVNNPWTKAQFVSQSCDGWGGICQSDFSPSTHGNFEVLVDECEGAVVHYWHPNDDVRYPWLRSIRFDMLSPHQASSPPATKVVQLTGEFDREGWNGVGQPAFAFNRTESQFGIIGSDLGVAFDHRDRTYFLFGDTWRVGHGDPNDDLDAVAVCTDLDASAGLHLAFLGPPQVPGIPQDGFNVPLDGVSWNDWMYVFFSTDHYQAQGRDLMGRSVITRSSDGLASSVLYEVSNYKFVNISASIVDAHDHGLPGSGPQLVIFGSGRYRSSDVYLAVKPAGMIEETGQFRYYAGGLDEPRWSSVEEDAMPLFCEGSVGELSVRWNPILKLWICLYNDDAPTNGIVARQAGRPWGEWSSADVIFRSDDGLGRFMHKPGSGDHVQEGFGADRSNDWGGVYGPYQITRYTRAAVEGAKIYFTMSVWNPYQTMLMTTSISAQKG